VDGAEEAEEEGLPVVGAVAAEEGRVGDDAEPLLADERGAREGGGLGGEAHENLAEDVFAVQRERRRQGPPAAAAAGHGAELKGIGSIERLKISDSSFPFIFPQFPRIAHRAPRIWIMAGEGDLYFIRATERKKK
jgi:hypothetical protein